MKKLASILTIFLSIGISAQTPLVFSVSYNADMGFDHYNQGYDEALFTPQVMALKGKVRSCTVEEIIPESRIWNAWRDSMYLQSYQLSYKFNNDGKIEELDINLVTKGHQQPDKVKTDVRQGFLWDGTQLKVQSFLGTFLNRSFLSIPQYDSHHTIQSEKWYTGRDGIFTGQLPFTVKYDYQKDGSYEVQGFREPDSGKEKILKFKKRFDAKGRLTDRYLYTRDLRKVTSSEPKESETFHYEYNAEGRISKMTYQKGDAKPVVHVYDYKDQDAQGNYTLMQVRNENNALLYEIAWVIKYSEQ